MAVIPPCSVESLSPVFPPSPPFTVAECPTHSHADLEKIKELQLDFVIKNPKQL